MAFSLGCYFAVAMVAVASGQYDAMKSEVSPSGDQLNCALDFLESLQVTHITYDVELEGSQDDYLRHKMRKLYEDFFRNRDFYIRFAATARVDTTSKTSTKKRAVLTSGIGGEISALHFPHNYKDQTFVHLMELPGNRRTERKDIQQWYKNLDLREPRPNLLSNFYVVTKEREIWEIYDILSQKTAVDQVGRCLKPGFEWRLDPNLQIRRSNLRGIGLRIARATEERSSEMISPTIGRLAWDEIARRFNLSIGSEGFVKKRDIRTSAGQLLFDVITQPLQMSTERYEHWDFVATSRTRAAFIYIKPNDDQFNTPESWKLFLQPFSLGVWVAIGTSTIIATIVMCTCLTIEDPLHHALQYLLCPVFTAFCQQGIPDWNSRLSARTVFIFSYILGTVLYASYAGSLIAYFTVSNPQPPFEDWRGLLELEAQGWKRAFPYDGYFEELMKAHSDDPQAVKFIDASSTFVADTDQTPQLIPGKLFPEKIGVYTQEWQHYEWSNTLSVTDRCRVGVIRDMTSMPDTPNGFLVSKRSGLATIIRSQVVRFLEVGIFKRVEREVVEEYRRKFTGITCEGSDGAGLAQIPIYKFVLPLTIIALGFTVSIAILTIEICVHRRKTKIATSSLKSQQEVLEGMKG